MQQELHRAWMYCLIINSNFGLLNGLNNAFCCLILRNCSFLCVTLQSQGLDDSNSFAWNKKMVQLKLRGPTKPSFTADHLSLLISLIAKSEIHSFGNLLIQLCNHLHVCMQAINCIVEEFGSFYKHLLQRKWTIQIIKPFKYCYKLQWPKSLQKL